jgi:hypothetical protein
VFTLADKFSEFEAVDARHLYIEQDEGDPRDHEV